MRPLAPCEIVKAPRGGVCVGLFPVIDSASREQLEFVQADREFVSDEAPQLPVTVAPTESVARQWECRR